MPDYEASTFGTPAPISQEAATETPNEPIVNTVTNNEPSATTVNENGSLETPVTPVAEAPNEVSANENDFKFEMPEGYQPEPQPQENIAVTQPQSIKEILTKLNDEQKAELLTELGIDEFSLNLNKHIKNGGQPIDYINAKGIDWNKVSDTDLLKDQLRTEFPDATPAQIERFYNKKYNQLDSFEDEDKEDGLLMAKADARKIREQRVAKQQSFKIPEVAPQQTSNNTSANDAALQQQQLEKQVNYFKNHDVTKSIQQSKRVAIDTGYGILKMEVENPSILTDVITKREVNAKFGVNKQGEPDVQLLNEMALYKMNPSLFKKGLIEMGIRIGKQKLVEEGQNPSRPNQQTSPTPKQEERGAWKGATESKFGSN